MAVPIPPASNPGGVMLDKAIMSGQPGQSQIPVIEGSPESVVYAPAGYVLTTTTGDLYVKSTPGSVATGWKVATLT